MILPPGERLVEIVRAFSGVELLVVGDVLLDTYLSCNALGVADEAPVPLLEIAGRNRAAGGAGNVAVNLARLGIKTYLVGTVGRDTEAELISKLLLEAGVHFQPWVVDRPTPHKTRILSGQHYYLRLDEEAVDPISEADSAALEQRIDESLPAAQAVLVSDYDKGTLTESLARRIETLARRWGLPIFADLKPKTAGYWRHLSLMTPNLSEARALLAESRFGPEEPTELAMRLSQRFGCDVVLKMSGDGMVAADSAGQVFRLEAGCAHPKSVSGAGDTVLSVLSAALVCGAQLREAACLANLAAAIAVSHEETHAVSTEELLAVVRSSSESGFQI
jgi:rfaE bifunctional protein kinase chain/domain